MRRREEFNDEREAQVVRTNNKICSINVNVKHKEHKHKHKT